MPVSIAPSALAQSLDEGWGDDEASDVTASTGPLALPSTDESTEALAPARVPLFDEQPASATKAAKAIARAASAVAAAKARRAAVGSASATLTGGFFALPRAATEAKDVRPDTRGVIAEVIDTAPIAFIQAIEPTAPSAPVATTETIELSVSPSVQHAAMPSSLPPPVSDDDSDWEVPSTRDLDAASIEPTVPSTVLMPFEVPPMDSQAVEDELVAADIGEATTNPEAPAVTAVTVSTAAPRQIRKSEPPTGRTGVSPRAPTTPAAKTFGAARPESATIRKLSPTARASVPPNAIRDSAAPSMSTRGMATAKPDMALATAPARAPQAAVDLIDSIPSDSQRATAATAAESLPRFDPHDASAAIDITIPPSFPHGGVDPDALSPGTPSASPRPSSPVSTASEGSSHLELVEPLSSMSPVIASTEVPRARSKLWTVVAAAAVVVGLIWGFAGLKQVAKSEARRSPLDAVTVVAAPKPQDLAAVAHQPNAAPEPSASIAAAEPPPTGTQVDRQAPALAAEQAADKKKGKRHYATAAMPARKAATPAAAPETKSVDSAASEESSSSLNAAASPQIGIVDPKAFPPNEGAAAAAKVRVEVDPPDSKIAVRGRLATAPYLFDVPKGTRVVLEVARAGYITRRIVLDGSRDFVKIAMIPEPKTQASADDTPGPAPSPAPAPVQENPTEP